MAEPDNTLELTLAKILSTGVVVSAGLLLVGMGLVLATRQTGYPALVTDFSHVHPEAYPHTPAELLLGLKHGRPLAIVSLGLLVLILTPMLRVASSVILFLRERDFLYAGIGTAVFLMLLLGMALGGA